MCVLYVSFGSKVRPWSYGCVAMGSAVLFHLGSRLLLYSAGSGVNQVQVVFPEFNVRLFCFIQAKTVCRYGCMFFLVCTRACVCRCDGDVQVRQQHPMKSGIAVSATDKYVRTQISIMCNRIEYWGHIRCACIRRVQYRYQDLPSAYIIQNHNTHRDNTAPSSPTLNQDTHLLTPHHHNPNTGTHTHVQHSPCSYRISKA